MKTTFCCHLSHRTIVTIRGQERRSFLQGLISNDVDLCAKGEAIYAGFLTPQGKFLHDLFIVEKDETLLIDCETERCQDLMIRLAAYKLRSKVDFSSGPASVAILALSGVDSTSDKTFRYPDPRHPALGERIIVEKSSLPPHLSDASAYDTHRLHLGIADGSRDLIIEKSTLSDGNFDLVNGISWTKGCYLGQELTARMHYRALIKKRLYSLDLVGASQPAGSPIKMGLDEVGELRSSNDQCGVGFLNVDRATQIIAENAPLTIGNSKASLRRPFWFAGEDKP